MKRLILAAVFLVLCVINAPTFGQQSKCYLNVTTYEPNVFTSRDAAPLEGVRIVITNLTTRKVHNPTFVKWDKYHTFDFLTRGKYSITATKVGFKRSIDRVFLECNPFGLNTFIIMHKGLPTQTVVTGTAKPVRPVGAVKGAIKGKEDRIVAGSPFTGGTGTGPHPQ